MSIFVGKWGGFAPFIVTLLLQNNILLKTVFDLLYNKLIIGYSLHMDV